MPENYEQPREFDAVLGNQHSPFDGSVVLGGIESVKSRLTSTVEEAQIAAVYDALKYGESGLYLLLYILDSNSIKLKLSAYRVMKNSIDLRVQKELQKRYYQFFNCLRTLQGHSSKVNSICLNLDASILYSDCEDGSINTWDWQTGNIKYNFSAYGNVNCLQFCPDGRGLLIGIRGANIGINHLHSLAVIFPTNGGCHRSLVTSLDGRIIFTDDSLTNQIKGWDCQKGKIQYSLLGHSHTIFSLAISRDGKYLFSGAGDYTIKIWDWKNSILLKTLEGHSFLVMALCLSRDGKTLFTGSGDYSIKIWDWKAGELKSTLIGHSLGVNTLAISPDGLTLFSGSNDKTIKIWNWQTGEIVNTLEGHSGEINSIVISPDGKYLFSGSHDTTVKVWGIE